MAEAPPLSHKDAPLLSTPLESELTAFHPLVSWRSILGGLLVTLLTQTILVSLGMAVGGISLDVSNDTSATSAGVFTGIWFLISSLISLFVGSYFAARISKFHTNRIGSAQGLVIAALFFGFFLWQTVATIGWVGRTAGQAIGGSAQMIGAGISQAGQSPIVGEIVEDALGDLNLRSDPQVVMSGVAGRLLRGNTEGAKNYLARQAGISPEDADRRIAALQTQVNQSLLQARETAINALQGLGWSLFATLLLGTAAALSGGALGSRANLRKPLTREQVEAMTEFRTAPV